MGPWWLTWHLCLYICEKCGMSRLWHTNTRTDSGKVEQYSVWAESTIQLSIYSRFDIWDKILWLLCIDSKKKFPGLVWCLFPFRWSRVRTPKQWSIYAGICIGGLGTHWSPGIGPLGKHTISQHCESQLHDSSFNRNISAAFLDDVETPPPSVGRMNVK